MSIVLLLFLTNRQNSLGVLSNKLAKSRDKISQPQNEPKH